MIKLMVKHAFRFSAVSWKIGANDQAMTYSVSRDPSSKANSWASNDHPQYSPVGALIKQLKMNIEKNIHHMSVVSNCI